MLTTTDQTNRSFRDVLRNRPDPAAGIVGPVLGGVIVATNSTGFALFFGGRSTARAFDRPAASGR